MIQTTENSLPWYRQFWFWFVFGPLIFIIVLCVFTVSTAFHYADDVVTDNYYKDGVMINKVLQQDQRAAVLGLKAVVKFDQLTGEILVSFNKARDEAGDGVKNLPKQLLLFMDNPVKKDKDQQFVLQEVSAGLYRADLSNMPQFSWYLTLVPESDEAKRKKAEWSLSGEINFVDATETRLLPRTQ
jgi:uncharacterized protein